MSHLTPPLGQHLLSDWPVPSTSSFTDREGPVHSERASDGTVLHHVLLESLYGAETVR